MLIHQVCEQGDIVATNQLVDNYDISLHGGFFDLSMHWEIATTAS